MIAKHDFEDGDEVHGLFIAMGPASRGEFGVGEFGLRVRIFGLPMSVLDITPTILHLYGISAPAQMKRSVLTEIFAGSGTPFSQQIRARPSSRKASWMSARFS